MKSKTVNYILIVIILIFVLITIFKDSPAVDDSKAQDKIDSLTIVLDVYKSVNRELELYSDSLIDYANKLAQSRDSILASKTNVKDQYNETYNNINNATSNSKLDSILRANW